MNNLYFYILILFFIWILVFWITIVIKFSKKRKLSNQDKRFFRNHFKKIHLHKSYKEKIIYYDKLYHNILKSLWYEWTFWEILKIYPNEINDINTIWTLHKLRNKLVHEMDSLSDRNLKNYCRDYEIEIKKIIK